jgi:hypothetical protein
VGRWSTARSRDDRFDSGGYAPIDLCQKRVAFDPQADHRGHCGLATGFSKQTLGEIQRQADGQPSIQGQTPNQDDVTYAVTREQARDALPRRINARDFKVREEVVYPLAVSLGRNHPNINVI